MEYNTLRFRLIEFDDDHARYVMITHDECNDGEFIESHKYGVSIADSLIFVGPTHWADHMLDSIKEALENIERHDVYHYQSPCYMHEDIKMITDTYAVLINKFNECFTMILETEKLPEK